MSHECCWTFLPLLHFLEYCRTLSNPYFRDCPVVVVLRVAFDKDHARQTKITTSVALNYLSFFLEAKREVFIFTTILLQVKGA